MFRCVLGDPNRNDFIRCIVGHPAAVHTAHGNHDSELVIQPRATEPVLTEQPEGNSLCLCYQADCARSQGFSH